jgi:hypothetical protein
VSNFSAVTSGVPQGSVLGPLLFLIFVNDVCDVCRHCTCKLFADDLKMYARIDNANASQNLTSDLSAVSLWCQRWQFSLATQKCSVLHVGGRFGHSSSTYTLANHVLSDVTSVRDLGVIMSGDLSPSEHVATVCAKANQRAGLIFRAFSTRRWDILLRAFIVYVRPLLEYCSPIWSPCSRNLITKLERVQRSFTRRLPGLRNRSYADRLAALGLQPLQLRRLQSDLVLCFSIVHGFTALNFDDFFSLPARPHLRGHSLKLELPRAQVKVRKNFFACRIIPVWNALPEEVVDSQSCNVFRSRLNRANVLVILHRFLV